MRVKTLKAWHKYRKICYLLLGWVLLSVIMISWIWLSLMDWRGPLAKIEADYSVKISAKDVEALNIQAEGVKLELVATADTKKISAYLYGSGYMGHKVWLYEEEGTAFVQMADAPIVNYSAEDPKGPSLTLRVIVPKKDYERIVIKSPYLMAEIYQMRGDHLVASVDQGGIILDDSSLKEVELQSKGGTILLVDNTIRALGLSNQTGLTQMKDNKVKFCDYQGDSGDFLASSKTIKGVWSLKSGRGDIIVETRRVPYDLLVDLNSRRGQVMVDYDEKEWTALLESRLQARALQGSIGQGNHILQATSDEGQISLSEKKVK